MLEMPWPMIAFDFALATTGLVVGEVRSRNINFYATDLYGRKSMIDCTASTKAVLKETPENQIPYSRAQIL